MTSQATYDAFQKELFALEAATGLYLADENVDAENVDLARDDADYWSAMLLAAQSAAGIRAEEAGHDINRLLGRVVY